MVFTGIVEEMGEVLSMEMLPNQKMWDGSVSDGWVLKAISVSTPVHPDLPQPQGLQLHHPSLLGEVARSRLLYHHRGAALRMPALAGLSCFDCHVINIWKNIGFVIHIDDCCMFYEVTKMVHHRG